MQSESEGNLAPASPTFLIASSLSPQRQQLLSPEVCSLPPVSRDFLAANRMRTSASGAGAGCSSGVTMTTMPSFHSPHAPISSPQSMAAGLLSLRDGNRFPPETGGSSLLPVSRADASGLLSGGIDDEVALHSLRTVPDPVSGVLRDGFSRRWLHTLYTYAPVEAEFCVFFYANRMACVVWMVVLACMVVVSMFMYQNISATTARNLAAVSAAMWLLGGIVAYLLQRRRTEIVSALSRDDEAQQSNVYVYLVKELHEQCDGGRSGGGNGVEVGFLNPRLSGRDATVNPLPFHGLLPAGVALRRRALHCNTFTQELVLIVSHVFVVVYGIGNVMAPTCEKFFATTSGSPAVCQRGVRIFTEPIILAVAIPLIVALPIRTFIMVPLYVVGVTLFFALYWIPGVPYWGSDTTMPPAVLLIVAEVIVCLTTAVIRERRRRTGFERHVERQRRSAEVASLQKHIERVTAAHLPLDLLLNEADARAASSVPKTRLLNHTHLTFSSTVGSASGGPGQLDALLAAPNAVGGACSSAVLLRSFGSVRGWLESAATTASEPTPDVLRRETPHGIAVLVGLQHFRAWSYAHGPSAIVDVVSVLHETVDSCVAQALVVVSSEKRGCHRRASAAISEVRGAASSKENLGEEERSRRTSGTCCVRATKCHTLDGGDSILIIVTTRSDDAKSGASQGQRSHEEHEEWCMLKFVAEFIVLASEHIPLAVAGCTERLSRTSEGHVQNPTEALLPVIAACEGACGCLFEAHTHNMVGYGPAVRGAEELCCARHATRLPPATFTAAASLEESATGAHVTTTTLLWRGLQPSSTASIVSLLCSSSSESRGDAARGLGRWISRELSSPGALGSQRETTSNGSDGDAAKLNTAEMVEYCVTTGAMPEGRIRSYLMEALPSSSTSTSVSEGAAGTNTRRRLLIVLGCAAAADESDHGRRSGTRVGGHSPSTAPPMEPVMSFVHERERCAGSSTRSGNEPAQLLLPFASLGDSVARPPLTPPCGGHSGNEFFSRGSPPTAALTSQPIIGKLHGGGNGDHNAEEDEATEGVTSHQGPQSSVARSTDATNGGDHLHVVEDFGRNESDGVNATAAAAGPAPAADTPDGTFECLRCCGVPYRYVNPQTEADYQLMSDNPELADYELQISSFSSVVSLVALLVANSVFSGTPGLKPPPHHHGEPRGDYAGIHDAPHPSQMPVMWCALGLLLTFVSLCAYAWLQSYLSRVAHHLVFIPAVQLCYLCAVFLAPRHTVLGETQGMFVIVCLTWCSHRPMFLPLSVLLSWDFFLGVIFILREQLYLQSRLPLQTFAPAAYILGATVTLCVRDYTRRQAFQVERHIEVLRAEIEEHCKTLESALDRLVPSGIAEPLVRRVRLSQCRIRRRALFSAAFRGPLLPSTDVRNPFVAARAGRTTLDANTNPQEQLVQQPNVSGFRSATRQGLLLETFPSTHPRRSGSRNMTLSDMPFICLRTVDDQFWLRQKRSSRDTKRRLSGTPSGQRRSSGGNAVLSSDPAASCFTLPDVGGGGGTAAGCSAVNFSKATIEGTAGDSVQRSQKSGNDATTPREDVSTPHHVPTAFPLLHDIISALRDVSGQVQVVECTCDTILIVGTQSDTHTTTEERATLIVNAAKKLYEKFSSSNTNTGASSSSKRNSILSPGKCLYLPQSSASSLSAPAAGVSAVPLSGGSRVSMVVDIGPTMGAMIGSREMLFGFHGSTLQRTLAALHELSTFGIGSTMAFSVDVLDRSEVGLELQPWFPTGRAYLTSTRSLDFLSAGEADREELPNGALPSSPSLAAVAAMGENQRDGRVASNAGAFVPVLISRPHGLPQRRYVVQGM